MRYEKGSGSLGTIAATFAFMGESKSSDSKSILTPEIYNSNTGSQMHLRKKMMLLSGKSKLKIRFFAIVSTLFYASCYNETKSLSMEDRYNQFVTLGVKDSLQVKLMSNLEKLGLKEGQSKKIKIKQLLGFNFKKIYLIDKMIIDFAIPCSRFKESIVLANKEFCQFGVIYKNDGSIAYMRGGCDYDLMNLSRSFDKVGFLVNNPTEIVFPNDTVKITYSLKNRVPYLIESISHRKINLPICP